MFYLTEYLADAPAGAEPINWDMGTEMAAKLLDDINTVSNRQAPFKIECEDYTIYWAGAVLRIDIKKAAVS